MNSITIVITREEIEKQIQLISEYIDTYNYEWHRKDRPVKERIRTMDTAAYQKEAKEKLLKEMKRNRAHVVIYRMDGNYELIRRFMI